MIILFYISFKANKCWIIAALSWQPVSKEQTRKVLAIVVQLEHAGLKRQSSGTGGEEGG